MPNNSSLLICAVIFCCGCPIGSPRDHYRELGHVDTTIAISPNDDAVLFNAVGKGGRDLYLLNLTSKSVRRIAETEDYETAPSFSPDSRWVVYSAGVRGDRADHLFKMMLDGTSKTQLTHDDANDTSARFSPDGKLIVFARDKTHNQGGLASNWELGGVICLIDADGKNLRQLTADSDYAFEPHFSADGTEVLYSTLDGSKAVHIDAATSAKSLTSQSGIVPSVDGKFFVYSKGKLAPDCRIYIANADGTSERCLTPEIGYCFYPALAHAGDRTWFLLQEWPDGPIGHPKSSIWAVGNDGEGLAQIADLTLFDDPLNWKPKK